MDNKFRDKRLCWEPSMGSICDRGKAIFLFHLSAEIVFKFHFQMTHGPNITHLQPNIAGCSVIYKCVLIITKQVFSAGFKHKSLFWDIDRKQTGYACQQYTKHILAHSGCTASVGLLFGVPCLENITAAWRKNAFCDIRSCYFLVIRLN